MGEGGGGESLWFGAIGGYLQLISKIRLWKAAGVGPECAASSLHRALIVAARRGLPAEMCSGSYPGSFREYFANSSHVRFRGYRNLLMSASISSRISVGTCSFS